jgi:hypothetical protein
METNVNEKLVNDELSKVQVTIKSHRGMIHIIEHTLERVFKNIEKEVISEEKFDPRKELSPGERPDPKTRPGAPETTVVLTINDPTATVENVTRELRRFDDKGLILSIK